MEKKYYKAVLYIKPDIKLEVTEIDETNANGYVGEMFSFYGGNDYSGVFAVRNTKDKAIRALIKDINDEIKNNKKRIKELEYIRNEITMNI